MAASLGPELHSCPHCFLQLNYSAPQPTSTHRCNSHANCFFHLHNALIAPSWHLMLCVSLRRSPAASISVSFGPSASALNDHSTALADSFHWSTRPRSDSRCLPTARLLQVWLHAVLYSSRTERSQGLETFVCWSLGLQCRSLLLATFAPSCTCSKPFFKANQSSSSGLCFRSTLNHIF